MLENETGLLMDWNVEPILSFLLKLPELLGSLHYFAQQQSFRFSLGYNFVTGQHAFASPDPALCVCYCEFVGGGGAELLLGGRRELPAD